MMIQTKRTYSELITLPTFEERYRYLRLSGKVGDPTFGGHRYINQVLYHSVEWRQIRDKIIVRDKATDLGIEGRNIYGLVLIHHLNPITLDDVRRQSSCLFDPENLICVSKGTHDAIHFGDESLLLVMPPARRPNDTCPWR